MTSNRPVSEMVRELNELAAWLERSGGAASWLKAVRAAIAAIPSAVASDDVRDALVKAYTAGATEVHDCWMAGKAIECMSPDFTEAAHDYASEAVAAIPSAVASDVVERAYREAWHDGYATGDAGGSYRAVENDWLASDSRAALAAIPSAGGVEEKLAIPPTDGSQYHRPAWMGENCPTRTTCAMHGRCMPIIGHDCTLNTSASLESTGK